LKATTRPPLLQFFKKRRSLVRDEERETKTAVSRLSPAF